MMHLNLRFTNSAVNTQSTLLIFIIIFKTEQADSWLSGLRQQIYQKRCIFMPRLHYDSKSTLCNAEKTRQFAEGNVSCLGSALSSSANSSRVQEVASETSCMLCAVALTLNTYFVSTSAKRSTQKWLCWAPPPSPQTFEPPLSRADHCIPLNPVKVDHSATGERTTVWGAACSTCRCVCARLVKPVSVAVIRQTCRCAGGNPLGPSCVATETQWAERTQEKGCKVE